VGLTDIVCSKKELRLKKRKYSQKNPCFKLEFTGGLPDETAFQNVKK
jgi:hypothetical protein